MLVIFALTATHIPSCVTVAHTKLWIFAFFVIIQSEQICKCGTKYAHLVMIDHIGSTCVHHYIPSFITVAHKELWILEFFLLANQNRHAKCGIKYVHLVTTDHMGSTCANDSIAWSADQENKEKGVSFI